MIGGARKEYPSKSVPAGAKPRNAALHAAWIELSMICHLLISASICPIHEKINICNIILSFLWHSALILIGDSPLIDNPSYPTYTTLPKKQSE
jgi:hypothetical protein